MRFPADILDRGGQSNLHEYQCALRHQFPGKSKLKEPRVRLLEDLAGTQRLAARHYLLQD